jgi:hypothetical protein
MASLKTKADYQKVITAATTAFKYWRTINSKGMY